MTAGVSAIAATAAGSLLPLAILLPALGVLMSFLIGGRRSEWIALGLMPVELAVAVAIATFVWRSGQPLVYTLAGYAPPLGIALRADGFSAVMLVTAGLIAPAAALYARTNFATPPELTEKRAPLVFWTLLQGIQAALSLVFLGGDLFNLYVGLELLTFAAVPLVSLDGRPETVAAALRYLLFALFGSVFYLLGVALLYGAYGTLDIALLAPLVRPEPAVWLAAGLMTAGLLAKTALFPLHLWLPAAHANAPAAASAVLSGLVVKGSFFLVVRLWFDVLAALPGVIPGTILAALGSAAILFGSVLALRQARLKLLIAYSTVAQIGYLFLMFPLASGPWAADAFSGGVMQALSHAFAKAAMFLSAGLIAESLGHDRIADLGGAARAMPVTFLALGLGGLSLMGLPPSGGFAAKWLLMKASVEAGQWVWALVMAAGGLLAGGYLYRVLAPALSGEAPQLKKTPARSRESIALALALVALLLAFAPPSFFAFLQIGRPTASLAPQ
jgi:multicomponent Na+:H+ antiporter subunit D